MSFAADPQLLDPKLVTHVSEKSIVAEAIQESPSLTSKTSLDALTGVNEVPLKIVQKVRSQKQLSRGFAPQIITYELPAAECTHETRAKAATEVQTPKQTLKKMCLNYFGNINDQIGQMQTQV